MNAAFICRVGQTECEGKDFFLQNIVSCLVLWPRIRSAMPLQRQLSASWHLNGFGVSMILLGSYRSHKTGPRSSFTPKTSLATQNAIRIGNKWLGNDNSRALASEIFQTFINPSLSYFFNASNAWISSTRCSRSVGPKSSMILFNSLLLKSSGAVLEA